jgi:hypothetical protein
MEPPESSAAKSIMQDAKLQPENLQGLDIRSTPREEMELFPLDTFRYEYGDLGRVRDAGVYGHLPVF